MLDCLLWLSLRALSSKSLEIRKPLTSTSFLEASSPTADGGISPGTPGGLDDWADKLITPNSKASAYRKYLQVMQSWFFRYGRSEEHTSELQSRGHLVCRLLLEKKKKNKYKQNKTKHYTNKTKPTKTASKITATLTNHCNTACSNNSTIKTSKCENMCVIFQRTT